MSLQPLEGLYKKALEKIKGERGTVVITIGNIPKISKSNDIIGNCVQEWIPQWLEDEGLTLESNKKSQAFPDFTAVIDGKRYDMEVKCWNYNQSPAFDIANFNGFYREIFSNPAKLNAKYLIFGYSPTKHGFEIKDIFLKNLWDITSVSRKYPVGLQVKQGQPYAIRPFPFHKLPGEAFGSAEKFIAAIRDTRTLFPLEGAIPPDEWYRVVSAKLAIFPRIN
ncbi:MAG: NgoBV family restriction endonuclease [Defluviitaleaceae bacterium]|nr:NgoBV family restriction endonuclease [Defluviitaleaceae bacterium]